MFRRKNKSNKSTVRQLIAKLNPSSPIAEQYRTVRTNLEFTSVDQALQSILVTSSAPEEGKSVTVANLAVVYAQQGKKVLLIDADMRKPTMHYTFQLDNLNGLSTVLVGESSLTSAAQDSEVDNLNILSSGPIPPNPSELLASKRMEKLMEEAKEIYDVIIVDSPPVLAVTDAQILSNLVDGSLLVIRSGDTEYEAAEKAKEALERSTSKILGTVLNDREKKGSNSYYYYYGS